MNFFKSLFSRIGRFFSSPQGKQTIETINEVMDIAMPVVQNIALITGNAGAAATLAAVHAAYDKYGIPLEQSFISGNQQQVGNALQNLAVTVVQKNLPPDKADLATNIIVTAVNLAVTASKVAL